MHKSSGTPNPYGITSLMNSPIKANQAYDFSVKLSLPRSPVNVDRGNFMISLFLLDKSVVGGLAKDALEFASKHTNFGTYTIMFTSRRSVLVPYMDPIVSLASRVFFLFYHMLVHSSQTITLTVPLAERVVFSKALGVPVSAYVEVEAGQSIQIYDAELIVTAQLRGLRWLMFHYRLLTYLAFTFLFWICELIFMGVAWSLWSSLGIAEPSGANGKLQLRQGRPQRSVETEQADDDSDHPRQPSSHARQSWLKTEPKVKGETEQEHLLSEVPLAGGEADDEKEEDEEYESFAPVREHGVGTSYREEGRDSVRRRPRNLGD